MIKQLIASVIIFTFSCTSITVPQVRAALPLQLPVPGTMVNLSPAYEPAIIKGLTVHKNNPFLFDFIVDVGQDKMSGEPLKAEGEKLIKYFLASLAIPEKDLWVNLSPYEKDKTVPEALGQTDMGRDLLAQDYVLKQMTASLIYPEKDLGKKFWDKVYSKAQAMYGSAQVPVNTFNKVWIIADKAEVFERNQTAFVVGSHLKVMLEEDYLAMNKNLMPTRGHVKASQGKTANALASQIIRDIILPELEKEVNTGKNFANLRQIFNSIILSSWYKKNLKNAVLNQVYANKAKIKGIDLNDPTVTEQIYQQYLKAYKKGVFNYIKEAPSTNTHGKLDSQTIPRKYFSGGLSIQGTAAANPAVVSDPAVLANSLSKDRSLVSFETGINTGLKSMNAAMVVNITPKAVLESGVLGEGKGLDEKIASLRSIAEVASVTEGHSPFSGARTGSRAFNYVESTLGKFETRIKLDLELNKSSLEKSEQELLQLILDTYNKLYLQHRIGYFPSIVDTQSYISGFAKKGSDDSLKDALIGLSDFFGGFEPRSHIDEPTNYSDSSYWILVLVGSLLVQTGESKADDIQNLLAKILPASAARAHDFLSSRVTAKSSSKGLSANEILDFIDSDNKDGIKRIFQELFFWFASEWSSEPVPEIVKEAASLRQKYIGLILSGRLTLEGIEKLKEYGLLEKIVDGLTLDLFMIHLLDFTKSENIMDFERLTQLLSGEALINMGKYLTRITIESKDKEEPYVAGLEEMKDVLRVLAEKRFVNDAGVREMILRELDEEAYLESKRRLEERMRRVLASPLPTHMTIYDGKESQPKETHSIFQPQDFDQYRDMILKGQVDEVVRLLAEEYAIHHKLALSSFFGAFNEWSFSRKYEIFEKNEMFLWFQLADKIQQFYQSKGELFYFDPMHDSMGIKSMLLLGFTSKIYDPNWRKLITEFLNNKISPWNYSQDFRRQFAEEFATRIKENYGVLMESRSHDVLVEKEGLPVFSIRTAPEDANNIVNILRKVNAIYGSDELGTNFNGLLDAIAPFYSTGDSSNSSGGADEAMVTARASSTKAVKPNFLTATLRLNRTELRSTILQDFGFSVSELFELNPRINKDDGFLREGHFVNIRVNKRTLRRLIKAGVGTWQQLQEGSFHTSRGVLTEFHENGVAISSYEDLVKELESSDAAMTKKEDVTRGGIDLNTSSGMQWKIGKVGKGVEMDIDPAMIQKIQREGIDWAVPVILRMTPVASIWPLVGLQAPFKEKRLARI